MLRALLGWILILGSWSQPLNAQSPTLDSLENTCRCWLMSDSTVAVQKLRQSAPLPRKPTLVWQGKPTGLPISVWNAVCQDPPKPAVLRILAHWYQIPWPGRKLLVNQMEQRLPRHPCSQYLRLLLN